MKTRILLFLVLFTILLSPQVVFAAGWKSRHAMTAAQYEAEFNTWTNAPYGYRLISVAGYEAASQASYAAIWADETGPAWGHPPGDDSGRI